MSDRPTTAAYAFLSYASAERAWALAIADLLEARGLSVWLDRQAIVGGSSWSNEIVQAIRGCAALVVLVSEASMRSRNVAQEIQLAWEHDRKILPLLLEKTPLPGTVEYALAGRQWVEVLERPDELWLPEAMRALSGLGLRPRAGEPPVPLADPRGAPAVPPAPAPRPAARHNLPAPTTDLVGRERELAEVARLLGAGRLVTLTGTGGVGKTRLALAVAADLLAGAGGGPDSWAPRDGAWLAELAPLAEPALVPRAVAAAVGLPEEPGRPAEATLLEFLRERHPLLILDNCEHLVEACARLADALLRGCPGLRILATSREALGIAGGALAGGPARRRPGRGRRARGGPRGAAVRRAGAGGRPRLRADPGQRRRGGQYMPAAGRDPPGHRAGRPPASRRSRSSSWRRGWTSASGC